MVIFHSYVNVYQRVTTTCSSGIRSSNSLRMFPRSRHDLPHPSHQQQDPHHLGSTPLPWESKFQGLLATRALPSRWNHHDSNFSASQVVLLYQLHINKNPFRGLKHYLAIFNTDNMMLNHVNNVWKLLKTEIKRVPLTATGYPSENAPTALQIDHPKKSVEHILPATSRMAYPCAVDVKICCG